jgi:hypothetical protein
MHVYCTEMALRRLNYPMPDHGLFSRDSAPFVSSDLLFVLFSTHSFYTSILNKT